VYIAAEEDELASQGVGHAVILHWQPGAWDRYSINWPVVALCVIDESGPKLLGMGLEGRIHVRSAAGLSEEIMDTSVEAPTSRGDLRDMRIIGQHVFAAGMGRQVYQRIGPGRWVRADRGTVQPLGSQDLSGFNSIDGFSERDIYAAGFDGEIWHFDGKTWTAIDSPTNLALQRVKCVPPDTVYIAGQVGTLVRGRGDTWEVIPQDVTEDTFWGVEWFQEKLYLATSHMVYLLHNNDLKPVDMGFGHAVRCGHLHANDGVLWSVGQKDLAYTDGLTWVEVPYTGP
jgi:hypothetical protein